MSNHLAVPGRGKVIIMMRNAVDVAVSYFHHYLDYHLLFDFDGDWNDFFALFEAGDLGSGNYFHHIATWWPHRNDTNVLLLRYEEMRLDPGQHMQRIADFLGLEKLSEQRLQDALQLTSFEHMRSIEEGHMKMRLARFFGLRRDYRVRQGKSSEGRRLLNSEQHSILEEQYNRILRPLGVPREWALGVD